MRLISIPDLNRPGLALSGFFDSFAYQRIQLFGRGEVAYLNNIVQNNLTENVKALFAYPLPCCIFTHSLQPPQIFIDMAEEADCPVLSTGLESSEFSSRVMRILSNIFAPRLSLHGVLVEVYGLGILLLGNSGVGKSETALELIERGHRIISDDTVKLKSVADSYLIGSGENPMLAHHMEIRGLGIINITNLFGVGAIREKKQVQLSVELETWDSSKQYDRIGDSLTATYLGVSIPKIVLPVRPGRNVPILIETAARNERMKTLGYYSTREFDQSVLKWLESETARRMYFSSDDIEESGIDK